MDKFVLGRAEKGQMILDEPSFGANGWLESYRLRLDAKGCSSVLIVGNPPYGVSLAQFFRELSENWRGWEGAKSWAAMDDEFRVQATMNRTGPVIVEVTTNQNEYRWHLIAELEIEAGQLESIATNSRLFLRENENAL